MEDFKFLLYILAAVIFFVIQMWRKAFKTPSQTRTTPAATPKARPVTTPALPSTSYQDILKEMQASGERAKEIIIAPSPERMPAEKTTTEAKTLERTESRAKSLETIIVTPKEIIRKPSAIELARQPKPKIIISTAQPVNYQRLLQNPQNVRAAFILSEILNRRIDY